MMLALRLQMQGVSCRTPSSKPRQGRRLGVTTRAVAASERSVYEAIQQNSEFPPETTFPWGFQPPKDFVLPRYSPRAPPSTPTPKQLGYTMPGEFEKHAACWMGWPTSGYLWREGAKPAQEQYAGIAKAISQFEPLKMIASPGADAELARSYFTDAPNVEVVEIPIKDGWTRDWGPSFVAKTEGGSRSVAGVHWDYDGYGATLKKLLGLPTFMPESDWSVDYEAGRKLIESTGSKVFEAPIHIEGGSIHSDGEGTLVVTEECLLHPSRNPHYGKANIEAVLKEYLGLEKIIWLWKGVAGDDSVVNGHVDNFCCFLSPGVVALAWPNDENDFNDPQWEISMDAFERLSNTTDAKGRKLTIVKVPCPPAIFRTYKEAGGLLADHYDKGYTPRIPGERLSASYINHYKANGGAVLSRFGAGAAMADQRALDILGEAYCKYLDPNTKTVNVESREVLLNAGNVHCITQQQPAEW
ncbi:Agmatine deiminase [Chlorella vulgaris]